MDGLGKLASLPMDELNQGTTDLLRELRRLVASPAAQKAVQSFESLFDHLNAALKSYEGAAYSEENDYK
jgi:hypothetical protein